MLPCCQEKKIKIACEQAHAQAQAHSFLYCRAQAQAQAQDRWQGQAWEKRYLTPAWLSYSIL